MVDRFLKLHATSKYNNYNNINILIIIIIIISVLAQAIHMFLLFIRMKHKYIIRTITSSNSTHKRTESINYRKLTLICIYFLKGIKVLSSFRSENRSCMQQNTFHIISFFYIPKILQHTLK